MAAGLRDMEPRPPRFSHESEEADWWASPEGRTFLKDYAARKDGTRPLGSKLVAELAQQARRRPEPSRNRGSSAASVIVGLDSLLTD